MRYLSSAAAIAVIFIVLVVPSVAFSISDPVDLIQHDRSLQVLLATLLLLIAFCVVRWFQVGRYLPKMRISLREDPPRGLSPGEVSFISKMKHDYRCFTADLLALAIGGFVRLERRQYTDVWQIQVLCEQKAPASLPRSQAVLLNKMFGTKLRSLVINSEPENSKIIRNMGRLQRNALRKHHIPATFNDHIDSVGTAFLLAFVGFFISTCFYGPEDEPIDWVQRIMTILVWLLMAVIVIFVFPRLAAVPTKYGRALMAEIDGFALYLAGKEKESRAYKRGSVGFTPLDADRYERLLPYAVALGVEEKFTKKVTVALGAAKSALAANVAGWWLKVPQALDLYGLSEAVGVDLERAVICSWKEI